jgi:integrase
MLTLYRRHRAKCKSNARNARCSCPIWIQGTLHGETIRRSLDLTNMVAAIKKKEQWEVHGIEESISVEDAYDRYLENHRVNHSAVDTLQKHRRLKKLMVEHFGNRLIREISVDDLDRFRQTWQLSATTTVNTINRVQMFFNFCVKRDWIDKSPARHLTRPKIHEVERKPFEPAEMKAIWEAVDRFPNWGIYGEKTRDRLRAFLTVLRWTGMRIGDCVQLEPSKIVNGQITIRTTKNGKRVSIPLHPDAQAALQNIKTGSRFYFWSGEGTLKSGVSAWERTMKRLYNICGFRAHCHRFRHNFATELLAKGVPISEVAAILGNSPRIVEKTYSQWISGRQDSINAAVRATF